ncbi:uncharacterized protein BX663DRAFT_499419 [Cokeromyces recurvatus]|uniref:uncharacterized protein n=1 Tax=Cokeromyces recurvatus TaxID=90255 RepID=UPI00221EA482|nr:uncharacterized protein BX663DRAFT_499419 [Cokeromyces recurvatus]KAI7906259.1 hypothetical protein BX663DRAFT_499419 [Cokeromyces recurvatus]
MDRLPTEIFIKITSYLSLDDKLNCILVCYKWYDLIKMAHLYKSLDFRKQEKLQQAILFFHDYNYKQSVQDLIISDCCNSVHRRASLPATFPNLKTLKFIATEEPKSIPIDQDSQLKKNVQMWQRLERVTERLRYYSITLCLLRSPQPVINLRSIHIIYHSDQFYEESRHAENYYKFRSLLRYIKNAPHLADLSISNTFISLKDLEEIHHSCPELETLALNHVNMSFSNRHINMILGAFQKFNLSGVHVWKSADRLHSLTISNTPSCIEEDIVIHKTWLHYLGQKYPNLSHLSLWMPLPDNTTSSTLPVIEEELITNFSYWTHLKNFNMNIYPFTSKIIQAMNMNDLYLEQLTLYGDSSELEKQLSCLKSLKRKENIKDLILEYRRKKVTDTTTSSSFWCIHQTSILIETCLLKEFKQLYHLSITSKEGIIFCNLDTFTALLRSIPEQLQTLEIEGLLLEPLSTHHDSQVVLEHPIQLKRLNIKNCFITDNDEQQQLAILNNWLTYQLLPNCPLLTSFDFDEQFAVNKLLYDGHNRSISVLGLKADI